MKAFDPQKIVEAVENTGYDLEHFVFELLKKKGWQVISNRYYIDDVMNIEREIDLIAYKAKKDDNKVIYYTVLLISCKKAKESVWAFLTRDKTENDPNIEYFLVDNHTTDKRLSFMLNRNQEVIKHTLCTHKCVSSLFNVVRTPFAFQQINKKSYKTEDDKQIYNSIITTIKALEYEKATRTRPKIESVDNYFYNFNLLSVFDGKMYDVFFDDGNKSVSEISEIKYINRHIVGKKESFYKVHFVSKDTLDTELNKHHKLYLWNSSTYPKFINDYYKDITTDNARMNHCWEDFCERITWCFSYSLTNDLKYKANRPIRASDFSFDYVDNVLKIHFEGYHDVNDSDFLEKINSHTWLMNRVKTELMRIYRYDGAFLFDDDYLPF